MNFILKVTIHPKLKILSLFLTLTLFQTAPNRFTHLFLMDHYELWQTDFSGL